MTIQNLHDGAFLPVVLRTSIAACTLAAGGGAQAADELAWKFSGFGTLGAVHASTRSADYTSTILRANGAGASERWSPDVDSRLGAQLDVSQVRWSAVLQVVSEQGMRGNYRPHIEWANVKCLVERIADALRDSGLPPQALEVEVTESSIMRDLARSVEKMRELEAMGVALSIDDFGTGYSSLSALKSFPISRLKIDKSFVSDLADSLDDQAIAMAVISLGHKLNLRVIAEGVETEQQRDFLRANDCDEMQGYLFSRPVPPECIAEMLAAPVAPPIPTLELS